MLQSGGRGGCEGQKNIIGPENKTSMSYNTCIRGKSILNKVGMAKQKLHLKD